jgi:hypothetical protein
MRYILTVAALALSVGVAHAQEAAPRGWAKDISQADCLPAKGLKWVPGDEVTSKNTGKTRIVKARCAVDSKAAAVILYKMHAKQ